MLDFKLQERDGNYDVANPLEVESGLRTFILISLFTDRRVTQEEAEQFGKKTRGGWWASDDIGSKLWLIDAGKITNENVEAARSWSEEALTWLVADGLASDISVSTSARGGRINIDIEIMLDGYRIMQENIKL